MFAKMISPSVDLFETFIVSVRKVEALSPEFFQEFGIKLVVLQEVILIERLFDLNDKRFSNAIITCCWGLIEHKFKVSYWISCKKQFGLFVFLVLKGNLAQNDDI